MNNFINTTKHTLSLRHTHTHILSLTGKMRAKKTERYYTEAPYGGTLKSVVTLSYITQVGQTAQPAGPKTNTDAVVLDSAK